MLVSIKYSNVVDYDTLCRFCYDCLKMAKTCLSVTVFLAAHFGADKHSEEAKVGNQVIYLDPSIIVG